MMMMMCQQNRLAYHLEKQIFFLTLSLYCCLNDSIKFASFVLKRANFRLKRAAFKKTDVHLHVRRYVLFFACYHGNTIMARNDRQDYNWSLELKNDRRLRDMKEACNNIFELLNKPMDTRPPPFSSAAKV